MLPLLTPQDFVSKWRRADVKERSGSQEHFIDVCNLIGHPTPVAGDPTGQNYLFEAGADKHSGGHGWADVWKRGFFAWEYKGKHANLEAAYDQLLQYRDSLLNPPLLIVSDMDQIIIRTNFTNTARLEYKIILEDLLTPEKLSTLRAAFFEPEALRSSVSTAEVTSEAAARFARLADLLRKWGIESSKAAHFLIRVLFCLFAEDAGLLPRTLFTRMVEVGRTNSKLFASQLQQLFGAMSKGGPFGVDVIFRFDGGLFEDESFVQMDSEAIDILYQASTLDWSNIEPAIFGTLFERSLDPNKRSQLGAHYTSKEDILLILEPVLMSPLRARWTTIRSEAIALAQKRTGVSSTQRARINGKLKELLLRFSDEIGKVSVLDPACGSGNFLYLALRLLLDLQKEIITLSGDLGIGRFFPSVNPAQLHGIETSEYAHELAQATVWIGYIQWLRENGFGFPAEPILKPLNNILLKDAILTLDSQGHSSEPEWPTCDVIVGNPPFLGGARIRAELGDTYVESLFAIYRDRIPNFSDLCCYWFEKARQMIASGKAKRAGLLATQGIRGGANREVLRRIIETGGIFWAVSDREWVLDGAAVHVSMVGFDDGKEKTHILDGKTVETINPDLTTSLDLTIAKRLSENSSCCFMGPSAKGPFDISAKLARQLISAPANTNGRPNSDVVRPVASAVDLVQASRNMWTIDFGLMGIEEASKYELPFEYLKRTVYPIRKKNRRKSYRDKWWRFAEPRPGMRGALTGKSRFLATPGVSKHRLFVWVKPEVLCNQGTLVFAREDDYFFGVMQSKAHQLWALATGTQLREAESGFRYTPTTTFETFPFPWPLGGEPKEDVRVQAIEEAARDLLQQRERWLRPSGTSESDLNERTLTNLYNESPTWLQLAHGKLDKVVFAAYGWPSDITDQEILGELLALNVARAR
ncbi:MAG: DNA methyltransferase [Anaerolineales bacterium]